MYLLHLFTLFMIAPKIDLIGFGGSALRAEDFIWLTAVIFHVVKQRKFRSTTYPPHFRWFFAYLLISIISFVINVRDAGFGGIFYILRQLQYCSWGMMALSVAPSLKREEVSKHLQFIGVLLSIWGALEFAGLIPKVGKFSAATGRLSINTTGPFEASVLLVALGFAARNLFLKGGLMVVMLLTQARITLLGAVAAALAARPRLIVPAFVGAVAVLAALPLIKPLLEDTRFSETQKPTEMVENIGFMWGAAPTFKSRREFLVGAGYLDKESSDYFTVLQSRRGDVSFSIRAYRWSFIIKTWCNNFVQILVGYSPGYFGQGVDSNVVRLIGESGLIGGAFFVIFVFNLLKFKRSTLTWATTMCMVVTAIFIDIFWSSKVMTLLWFVSSWELVHSKSLANPMSRLPVAGAALEGWGRPGRARGRAKYLRSGESNNVG